jgi:hypothetical protein
MPKKKLKPKTRLPLPQQPGFIKTHEGFENFNSF